MTAIVPNEKSARIQAAYETIPKNHSNNIRSRDRMPTESYDSRINKKKQL